MSEFHVIPESIKPEVEKALTYYLELAQCKITFKFKKNIKKSTMQAQPTIGSFFKTKKNRSYQILISEKFKIADKEFSSRNIPSDVFIGWIGHELGHVMDYQSRSKLNLIWFGIKYLLFDNHIIEAERTADKFAIEHKMEYYILKTKNFILTHSDISEAYKNRIKRYYLSPEEIMVLIKDRDKLEEVVG
jgi:isocitrate dehydrogenase